MTELSTHPYHLVNYSPWPLTGAISMLTLALGLIKWFHSFNSYLMIIGVLVTFLTMYQWWRDITREGTLMGSHTMSVINGLKWGMIMFIVSEILLFFSFFWSFFHSSLTPNIELGMNWPPKGINPMNPFQVPLLNSIILLSSGVTVTWAHQSLLEGNHNLCSSTLMITVLLGIYFSLLQVYEYLEASYSMADSVYGSSFFLATGFHGMHVIIGSVFLYVCLWHLLKWHFSSTHHYGIDAAAWYWHFVDVIWLILYMSIYWWGS